MARVRFLWIIAYVCLFVGAVYRVEKFFERFIKFVNQFLPSCYRSFQLSGGQWFWPGRCRLCLHNYAARICNFHSCRILALRCVVVGGGFTSSSCCRLRVDWIGIFWIWICCWFVVVISFLLIVNILESGCSQFDCFCVWYLFLCLNFDDTLGLLVLGATLVRGRMWPPTIRTDNFLFFSILIFRCALIVCMVFGTKGHFNRALHWLALWP